VGTLLALVGALVVLAIVGVVAVKVTRAATGTGTPRRREFNRVVRERHDAVYALHELQKTVNLWRASVTDDAGVAFLDTVQQHLTAHNEKTLGENK